MDKFKLITCRDAASYGWLRENTRKPEVHVLPDIVFSLPEEWLQREVKAEMLGISLMHRQGDREDCPYYRAMAAAADQWIRKTGKGVILIAFDTGKEDDLFACRAVQSLMQFPDWAEIVAHTDCTEIPAAFARCEKIIGARLHATVLALRMGIPVYPLAFREKVRNLLKDIQYPVPACDLDAIDNVSLYKFLESDQDPYPLKQDIYVRASEHMQLLQQQLEKECGFSILQKNNGQKAKNKTLYVDRRMMGKSLSPKRVKNFNNE